MDLYQIHYFLAIAEVGSFTKAAEQLYVSQPSLSAGIKKLEQDLDVQLFERVGRGVLLTSAGRLFQEKAQSILAEYKAIRQDLEQLKDAPTLRIATLHTLRADSLTQIVGRFHEQYPNVAIEILQGYFQDIQQWLEQGDVDLAITWLRGEKTIPNSQALFHQPLALAVHQDHSFAERETVCLAELDGHAYINRINCELWQMHPKLFATAGIEPKFIYSSNNEEWAISLIQAGMGVSIMPMWKRIKNIVYVPISDLDLNRTIGLQWRGKTNLKAVSWFRDFVADCDWQVAS
ncbi:transcriptional regulator, LysR family [[Leptolyngbya] sp. PCC 7376]|uniref:LysR family transcriptional regulator n=1 Tax=[Leptolyngbya] sp. PCC 7376 TaxID=111781 RepID=UPI00029F2E35|nr:LysR family transcriptional regulator [[Leptolyngbya] sp. PCC 7376]AFY38590.1 transcriptional regulator, LysR family [[Leptolyngbya] sp. PCC 7376]